MREIAVAVNHVSSCPRVPPEVLLACGEKQRQCLDLKLDAQRCIAAARAPQISYSKYAEFLDEAIFKV
eukprot:Skav236498  [mRNA]  locus=scaffold1440:348200:348680:+ [translate_table: standard]